MEQQGPDAKVDMLCDSTQRESEKGQNPSMVLEVRAMAACWEVVIKGRQGCGYLGVFGE